MLDLPPQQILGERISRFFVDWLIKRVQFLANDSFPQILANPQSATNCNIHFFGTQQKRLREWAGVQKA